MARNYRGILDGFFAAEVVFTPHFVPLPQGERTLEKRMIQACADDKGKNTGFLNRLFLT
jgi:hypothetical protein